MDRSIRIILFQLPVQELDSLSTEANVPLAAGYLAGYLEEHLQSRILIEIPSGELQNFGGDAALLSWIQKGNFDLIGFTLYLWNRERSIHLAGEVRKQFPQCTLVAGGPETEHPVGLEVFHSLVQGEGEKAFLQLVLDLQKKGIAQPFYRQETPLSLDTIPNPYLKGLLPLGPPAPVYLETIRGCPNRCSYCWYGKTFPQVRRFPITRIPPLFELSRSRGVEEIYLMDPSFDAGGNLENRITLLRDSNYTRIPLHTEIRLEAVTGSLAHLLSDAGFHSVEVGLQSINPRALKAVRRRLNLDQFQEGARLLKETGIQIRTGVILGLPEDDLTWFRKTLDFIDSAGLQEHLEVYLLSLLPGTELRQTAEMRGITYMNHPPYWVLGTPSFPLEDLYRALGELETRYRIEYHRPIIPRFFNTGTFRTYADLRDPQEVELLWNYPTCTSWDLTLRISASQLRNPGNFKRLLELGQHLFQENPYTYYKIVIEDDDLEGSSVLLPPIHKAAETLVETLFLPAHYGNLTRTYSIDPQGRFSARLFILTDRISTAEEVLEIGWADLILRIGAGSGTGSRLGASSPLVSRTSLKHIWKNHPLILIESALSSEWERLIKQYYAQHPELVLAGSNANAFFSTSGTRRAPLP
ncbi:MAG: radical SAM protein [Spirochaetales bacterium]|nr:radical SAM protein [Spirochaetales bacterium]